MSSVFETQKTIREILVKILDHHSLEQLNKIPDGFKNNLIWNIGHCIASQQILVYKLSGLPLQVSDELIAKYSKGTKPEADVSQEEVNEIRDLLTKTLLQTEKDYNDNVFKNYNQYTTSMGFDLKNVQDALDFVSYHEGIHTGIIMGIKKFI
ncbi:DinB superfamily protein [Flavobacterium sp. CF108]|uniref:DinB family protein n=1 Tax=unclassified Flavobacterium TaxID=196869 RepID=UPI0008B83CFF|nr:MULTISPECIES: DinB family protein [unclassified Flavobacterium]SEP13258.1 DinB superfamily protein [Flavobacterium sp. fv08]SHH51109.1 DinB superfamily protein [Flavobacterium sp. CF108]